MWVCFHDSIIDPQVDNNEPLCDCDDGDDGLCGRGWGKECARGIGWGSGWGIGWDNGNGCEPLVCSFLSLSLSQVSPKALAKWSSTELGAGASDGSFFAFKADQVLSPSARAKWSSTDPEMNKTQKLQITVNNLFISIEWTCNITTCYFLKHYTDSCSQYSICITSLNNQIFNI